MLLTGRAEWLILVLFRFGYTEGCGRSREAAETSLVYRGPEETVKDPAPSKLTVRDRWLVDGDHRVRLFHGFNAVEKQFPWYPAYLLNDTRVRFYRDWGFSVVRLGVMWAGVEPVQGQYNHTYLAILRNIVCRLRNSGLYVILDMHQDVFSSRFGSYDGVPLWVLDHLSPSPHPFPWPLPHIFLNWADGYLTQAVGRAFQGLYDNKNGTLDMLAGFWSTVAGEFGDLSNVLGYELINEPWAGDIYSRPGLLLPGVAGRDNLMPMYDHLNAAIRRRDPHSLLFYEPVTWGVVSDDGNWGTGFLSVPGGQDFANKSVLSFHYYCWLLGGNNPHRPPNFLEQTACDVILGPQVFHAVSRDIARTGGSWFLTEFGMCEPDGRPSSSATLECQSVMGMADAHLVSWTYWDSKFFFQNGSVNWALTGTFVRPYVRAVSGTPLFMKYDPSSRIFQLQFQPDPSIKAPTEIYVPRLHYPRDIQVRVSAGLSWNLDTGHQTLYIQTRSAQSSHPDAPVWGAQSVTFWPIT